MTSINRRSDPGRTTKPATTSYRTIKVVGLLLILQMIGLAGIGGYEFARVDWDQLVFEQHGSEVTLQTESEQVAEAIVFIVPFLAARSLDVPREFRFFTPETQGMAPGCDRGRTVPGHMPVDLYPARVKYTGLHLSHHGLLYLDGSVPELARGTCGVPFQRRFDEAGRGGDP
jgi:hypothetical protein